MARQEYTVESVSNSSITNHELIATAACRAANTAGKRCTKRNINLAVQCSHVDHEQTLTVFALECMSASLGCPPALLSEGLPFRDGLEWLFEKVLGSRHRLSVVIIM